MTTLLTRMRELANLEGFDVRLTNKDGTPVDLRVNGYPKYDYERKFRGTKTVSEWIETRFKEIYGDFACYVLNADGSDAHGNSLIKNIRIAYIAEQEKDEGVE